MNNRFYVDDEPLPRTMAEWFRQIGSPMNQKTNIYNTGKMIRDMRVRKGWSRERLAREMGLTPSTIRVMENKSGATFETFATYAACMGYKIRITKE